LQRNAGGASFVAGSFAPVAIERLAEIATWISQNSICPPPASYPASRFVSPRRMADLHYRGPLIRLPQRINAANDQATPNGENEILRCMILRRNNLLAGRMERRDAG